MDVGFYLGELLMQQGEVSVPGLGYFVQARVSGYYDENERKFFPPYHQAQFDPQSIDDDALAEYIAGKKNISVASARYFAEKYITNLKQQALITEVPIGNLGWFYTELAQLTFRPAAKIIDDTIFYGFEPVSVGKTNDVRSVEDRPKLEINFTNRTVPPKPTATETVNDTFVHLPPVNEEPVNMPSYETQPQNQISAEFFDPEEEHTTSSFNGPLRAVVFALVAVIIIGLGVFALHTYQPDTFAKIAFWKPKQAPIVVAPKPKPAPIPKPDTLASDSLKADTGEIASTPVKRDTVTQPALAKSKVISEVPVEETSKSKSKIISEVPVDANAKPKSRILSITPVDQGKVVSKKTVEVSKTPVNPTATPLPATPKKKETAVSQQTLIVNAPVTTKPATAKVKPAVTEAAVSSTMLNAKPSDAVGTRRFEVYATRGSSSIADANILIKKLRKYGLDPHVVSDASGTLIHISIGHFATKEEARDLAFKEIEAGHIPGGDAYALEIIPSK